MSVEAIEAAPARGVANDTAILDGAILPTMVRLSLPNMAAMLATSLVAIAETGYVGTFGTSSLAGLACVVPMVMLQQMMSGGAMGSSVSSAVSRALGAGDEALARKIALHAVVIGGCAGLAFMTFFLTYGGTAYQLLGAKGDALQQAMAYSNVVFIGVFGLWLTNTCASIIRGGGNMKVPSATLLLAALSQIGIGGALGFGWLGLPRLGIAGVACGQLIVFNVSAVFLLFYLASARSRVRLGFRDGSLSWPIFRDILKVGGFACLSPLQSVLTVLVLTRLVSSFGTEALAGYGIGSRLEFLLIPIAFAIGVACVPMVGMALGAGRVARARQVAWTGGLFSAALVGCVGVVVAVWPDLWAALFTRDAAVLASARLYFTWAGPTYVLFGLGLCLYFSSLGAGKVFGPMMAGTLRLLLVAIGGWWLAANQTPVWTIFALISAAMAVYGIVTALSVYGTSWEAETAR